MPTEQPTIAPLSAWMEYVKLIIEAGHQPMPYQRYAVYAPWATQGRWDIIQVEDEIPACRQRDCWWRVMDVKDEDGQAYMRLQHGGNDEAVLTVTPTYQWEHEHDAVVDFPPEFYAWTEQCHAYPGFTPRPDVAELVPAQPQAWVIR